MATGASHALEDASSVRARTRLYRNGHWFASLVFGLVILGSTPLYLWSTRQSTAQGFPLVGRVFQFAWGSRWGTVYWAVALVVGFALVVAYYHLRARRLGVQGRVWPAVLSGLGLVVLTALVNDYSTAVPDLWFRGTSVLLVIAVGLVVLAALERSRPFALFAAGFFGLALVCTLYTVVDVFYRLGISGPFRRTAVTLPNLLVPGAYLVIGGVLFLLRRSARGHPRTHPVLKEQQ